jgi:site-specific recombinase XerD
MNKVLTEALKAIRISGPFEEVVFCSRHGTPYRSFCTAFERAVLKAGITDSTFHDLHHPFASPLVMAGVDLPTVKELIGRKHIHMTVRYTHLSSDHKQRAVDTLEQCVEKVPLIFTTPQTNLADPHAQSVDFSSVPR